MDRGAADQIMRTVGWLSRQPERFRLEVLSRSQLIEIEAGRAIYRPGSDPDALYGVADGFIELCFANGHVGSVRSTGYWIGEGALFRKEKRHVAILAKTDVALLRLPCADFEELLTDPEYCRCFALLNVEHLEEALGIIANLLEHDPIARTYGRLMNLSRSQVCGDAPIKLTQTELASMCGLTRQTVSKVLKSLSAQGVVSAKYGEITMLNGPALP